MKEEKKSDQKRLAAPPILGIDLGTTYSAVGVMDSGFPLILADAQGRRLMPSAVTWLSERPSIAGWEAWNRRGVDRVITSAKRLMGRNYGDLNHDDAQTAMAGADGRAAIPLSKEKEHLENHVFPEQVAAEVLRALVQLAADRLEMEARELRRVVITVPAYFHEHQRQATKKAGELAGLEVLRLLSEPTAAALAYGLRKMEDSGKVAVYDLGGGTFDCSILEMREGVFEVLSTSGNTHLGGDDFDRVLADEACRQCGWEYEELPTEARRRALEEAERVKRLLGDHEEATMKLPFFHEDSHLEASITRGLFEELIQPFLDESLRLVKRALVDANCRKEDLSEVLLVGGSSRIPAVRRMLENFFDRKINQNLDPDEAVARGAAIQAGILSGAIQDVVLLDVTPLSLGVETLGGVMNVLIPRNSTIPCKRGELFTNASDGQKEMIVRVLQGERELAKDNWLLGELRVPFTPLPRGQARVGVQFALNADGLLEVLARDVATGQDQILTIESAAVNVADQEVERMVSESVEYAFEDMDARIFAEAKLKADELLTAVEVALAELQSELTPEDRENVRSCAQRVKKALEAGLGSELKAAVQELDQATESLATLLLEKNFS